MARSIDEVATAIAAAITEADEELLGTATGELNIAMDCEHVTQQGSRIRIVLMDGEVYYLEVTKDPARVLTAKDGTRIDFSREPSG